MPSCYLHNMFYKEFINKKENILFSNNELIKLGAQGPDIFFYYHRLFIFRNKEYMDHGDFLHKNDISKTFIKMIEYGNKIENKNFKNDIFSYIFGYAMHYILDRNFHPYINSFIEKNSVLNTKNHLIFEANLDVFLAAKNNEKIEFNKLLKIPKKDVKKVSVLFNNVNNNLKKNTYFKAYKEMILIRNLTKNGTLIKKIIKIFKIRNEILESALYPSHFEDNIDILNVSNKKYYNDLSYYQMFDICLKEANIFYDILKNYFDEKVNDNYESLINFIDNKDYNGNFCR